MREERSHVDTEKVLLVEETAHTKTLQHSTQGFALSRL